MKASAAVAIATLLTIGASAPAKPVVTVHIKNFAYVPAHLTVRVGDRVRFVNDDDEAHTVTAQDRSFDSGGMDSRDSWQHVFVTPGRFTYFCALHPYMKATITVTSATTGSNS